ncbi:hypothetical protein E1B28_008401 [Marasmius oreades]|uniref:Uncharacterized protein n=1 Tax=Marasmius oreades TaxID=181124 RepID=A0A9P7RYX2_9AGAR|nr:uncharacterized protein E1B28_008401 [Marasmius oreades]KAG7092018.1 hypothetical protein E1B28_008401 [Marasmius oreades]
MKPFDVDSSPAWKICGLVVATECSESDNNLPSSFSPPSLSSSISSTSTTITEAIALIDLNSSENETGDSTSGLLSSPPWHGGVRTHLSFVHSGVDTKRH